MLRLTLATRPKQTKAAYEIGFDLESIQPEIPASRSNRIELT